MNTSAIILMVATITAVTGITVYFLIKVLKNKPKFNEDNDEETN